MSGTTVRVSKGVWERRSLAKFGECAHAPPGPEDTVTMVGETFELRCEPVRQEEELLEKSELEKRLDNKGIVCSNCGEAGHFSLRCPKRRDIEASKHGAAPDEEDDRAAQRRSDFGDEVSVKVSNLSPDAEDDAVKGLIRQLGSRNRIQEPVRVHVVRDRVTRRSKGFAYLSFLSRDLANKWINVIDGYGFDSLILQADLGPVDDRPRRKWVGGSDDFDGRGGKDVAVTRSVPWRK